MLGGEPLAGGGHPYWLPQATALLCPRSSQTGTQGNLQGASAGLFLKAAAHLSHPALHVPCWLRGRGSLINRMLLPNSQPGRTTFPSLGKQRRNCPLALCLLGLQLLLPAGEDQALRHKRHRHTLNAGVVGHISVAVSVPAASAILSIPAKGRCA